MSPTAPDIPNLDELAALNGLLQRRVRLAICVLSKYGARWFSRLKEVLGEKDGSLGTYLRKREDAGYLAVDKTCRDWHPVTWCHLTAAGQQHLERHFDSLPRLIDRAQ